MSQQDQISPAPSAGQTGSAPAAVAAPAFVPPPASGGTLARLALPLFAALMALAFVALATLRWDEWVGAAAIQTTNDAYVKADTTQMSSRVAGEVLNVAVSDFQRIKAGDLLVQIDPADYQAQVAQAEAGVDAAQAAFDNLANQIELQYATIAQAEAQQASAQAQELEARQEQDRQQALTQTEAGTRRGSNRPSPPTPARRPMYAPAGRRSQRSAISSRYCPGPGSSALRISSPPGRRWPRPGSSSATPGSLRRSTAWSASARCSRATTSISEAT